MNTLLKWPGGKESELPVIRANMPVFNNRFVEPFVGGGAVFFDTTATECCINDKSEELINLYQCAKTGNSDFKDFIRSEYDNFRAIDHLIDDNHKQILQLYHSELTAADFIRSHLNEFEQMTDDKYREILKNELQRNLSGKIKRSRKLEAENGAIPDNDRISNIESALKSAYYMYVRYMLNHQHELSTGKRAAVFFFIREYCYSSMFRYNAHGEFNVPYGGISYNRKDFQKKIDYVLSDEMHEKLGHTRIDNKDFEEFINGLCLTSDDFMFLDPPYDSDFSTYAKNSFGKEEQIRLRDCLKRTGAKFMLVIKNTEFIYSLYKDDFNISSFDKKYLVSFMNRNEKQVKHLLITNY